ncbi:ATP-binding cassette, subfamily B, MsbA [Pedobacter steynii]|uniref:ATP-binding cassette, subfamily B, MsbA n=1 Tax=Pedobacter steynii TaxID=430522 RepID=A0A1H0EY51_9SPHI|nr:ABC transporter ATP-binding protein [Pedobacter steynii]NQX42268.1 ABC transporter ATP-binding protein [Pedobacter steynii]SDN87263.1 ATP-binding cassette, subfamily B, MsbA [Pedobacter steynii]
MKDYFRLLSFAKPIEKFAIPYVITTLLYILFNTLNLALLAPLLDTLFNSKEVVEGAKATTTTVQDKSWWDIMARFREVTDYYIHNYGPQAALKFVCLVIVASVLLSNIFRYLSSRIMEDLRVHTLLNLRKTVFNNVMNLHLSFFNSQRKGDIISKVSSDVQVVQFTVTNTLQVVFKEPVTLIVYIVLLFAISVKLTLFSLLIIPLSGLIIAKIVKRLRQQATQAHETFANMLGYLDEALSGIKIVKAFNATEYVKDRFQQENVNYSNITRKMVRRQQLASPVSEFLGVTMVAGIVYFGGSLVLTGESTLTSSQFIAYIVVFSQVMRPAKALSDAFSAIHTGLAAGKRVLDLIDEKPEIVDAPNAVDITNFGKSITFKDVSFAYGDRTILNHINIEIPKGKTVALVGPSGGGKSTLMDLLPRFIEPQEGSILIDDVDIREITVTSLRSQMGFVNQESILFNDTIFNNIAFAKPNASREEVMTAAKIANAHEFIMHTDNGYDTSIGDRGIRLSGGQRQRLCIARAILGNPPVMLLDEATSALDTESEKLVQDALYKLMENRTSLIIAHRLSTIQNADLIIVLDKAAIVEQGSHSQLMENNGLYRRLIDMQTFEE